MHQRAQHKSFVNLERHYRLRILRGAAARGQAHANSPYFILRTPYEIWTWTINCVFISSGELFLWGIVAFSVNSHSAPRGIMRIPSLKQFAAYGVAVLSVALATVVRLEFDPLFGETAPLLIFVIAVILTS